MIERKWWVGVNYCIHQQRRARVNDFELTARPESHPTHATGQLAVPPEGVPAQRVGVPDQHAWRRLE